MNNKVVIIRKEEDFDKIRLAKGCEKLTVFLLNDVSFEEGHLLLPIDLTGTEVVFYGLGNTLNNIKVHNVHALQSGMFSNVKNLYVKKLNVTRAKVIGDEVCGVLAGHVDENFVADGLNITSDVDCHAVSGGVVGVAKTVFVTNSTICSTVSGKGVLGGIAGMADGCYVCDSLINATFKPKTSLSNEKCKIDTFVGYLGSREDARVAAMTKEVHEYLEEKEQIRLML